MLKRILTLLALLLFACSLSALAEDALYNLIDNAMYRIVLRTQEGDVPLGSGVLYGDQRLLLTSGGCAAGGEMYAIGADGEHAIAAVQQLAQSGAALLEMETASAATPLHLASEDAAGMACTFAVNAQGDFIIAPLYQVRATLYQGQEALLISSSEGLLPGGFLCDERGGLIALSIAQHTEGQGAYIALDANQLLRAISRYQYADAFLPAQARWENGLLTLTWTDEERGSGVYVITLSGDDNLYYTSFETAHDQRAIELPLPPAHRYDFQVKWEASSGSAIEPVWSAMTEQHVPSAVFTRFGYTQECSLITRKNEKSPISTVSQVTHALLNDASLRKSLHIKAAYDVDEDVELPMTIELITPDGQFYYESALHTLSPKKETEDAFLLPLNELLDDCRNFSGGLQNGVYLLRYSLGGATAGEYSFTLTDDPAPAQAAPAGEESAAAGLVTGLSGEHQNGMIALSWPAESIPEGASVCVYYLYEGNDFYMYHQMLPGANETEIFTVPGRQTFIWVSWKTDKAAPDPMPDDAGDFFIVHASPETALTDHHFRNIRLGVVPSADPSVMEKGEFLPQVSLTREVLSNRDMPFYFQTEDTYQIDQTDDADHPLAIILYTPEGMCFLDPSLYIYDVTLQQSDLWLKDVSILFENYEAIAGDQAWPAGEYRILYCIDGKTAGEILFTLE